MELPLKSRIAVLVHSIARIFEHPLRFALLPPLCCTQSIQRHSKTNPHQPSAKPSAIAQPPKAAMRAQQGLLRDIFRVGIVSQHSSRHTKCQRGIFHQQRLPLAVRHCPCFRTRVISALGTSVEVCSGMGQDPLLHGLARASGVGSALLIHKQDAAVGSSVHRSSKESCRKKIGEVKTRRLKRTRLESAPGSGQGLQGIRPQKTALFAPPFPPYGCRVK